MNTRKPTVIAIAALMLLAVAAPAFAGSAVASDGSLTVSASDSGTVEVTHNGTGLANETVTVSSSENYTGTGDYTTDENGTVSLPAPEQNGTVNITVSVTAYNTTVTDTATLGSVNTSNTSNTTNTTDNTTNTTFGQRVSAYVEQLKQDNTSQPIGILLAQFVVANNPGNPPAHAGPPENKTRGPPENKTQGPPENKSQGPPEHAGPNKNDSDTSSDDGGNGGPPSHAGSKGK